jgi:hypothetical protein
MPENERRVLRKCESPQRTFVAGFLLMAVRPIGRGLQQAGRLNYARILPNPI